MVLQLVVSRFLDSCQQYVVCKKGNLSNWHPILGWFSQSFDVYLPPAMSKYNSSFYYDPKYYSEKNPS